MKIRCVGFDLDNTLYKHDPSIDKIIQNSAIEFAAKHAHLTLDYVREYFQEHYPVLGSARLTFVQMGIPEPKSKEIVQQALEYADVASNLKPDKALVRMMHNLKDMNLFLITGSAEEQAKRKLKALGLNYKQFNPFFHAHSSYRREDCSAFRFIKHLRGIPYENMLYVGDREKTDILPINEIGGISGIVNNSSEHATVEFDSIYDVETFVRNNI